MQAAASRHTAPCRGRRQDRLLQRGDIDTPKTWTCGCVVAAAMDGRGSECAHGCAPERSRHTRTSTAPSEANTPPPWLRQATAPSEANNIHRLICDRHPDGGPSAPPCLAAAHIPSSGDATKKAARRRLLVRGVARRYGRRASSASSLALGSRSCLVTLRKPRVSSGQAMKIEDIVPITAPIIWLSASPSSEPPPYRYSASTDRKNTTEVMMVRDRVWLMERSNTSSGSARRLRKFSRTRSNTTIVSLIEKPITDNNPASTVRSNSRPLQAK